MRPFLFLLLPSIMHASEFVDHASSPGLTADQTYTIELLIERVRSRVEAEDWDAVMKRSDAREEAGYVPGFPKSLVAAAAACLEKETWVSLQRIASSGRPVRVLDAVGCLHQLRSLFLGGNEVADLTPLRTCRHLRELNFSGNHVQDLATLEGLNELEEVVLYDNPITDFSVLQSLPNLKALEISAAQVPMFRKVSSLPKLQRLQIHGEFDSFQGFPAMPSLRMIWGATVSSLDGLEKFPNLENLVNFGGEFSSLQPLAGLKKLTHVHLNPTRVADVSPLAGLHALRELWLLTEVVITDVSPLEGLPALHKVTLRQEDRDHPALEHLRSQLVSWDVEFLADKPRHTPSLEIQVVSQEEFDRYDTKEPYGMLASDGNKELLSSELEWLDEKIEEVFAVDFTEDEDFSIPFQWGGARSRTIVLLSEEAVEAFPRLVLGIQKVLAHAKHDWIIYFQSDSAGADCIVWLYPDKIVVTPQHAKEVRQLVKPR